MCGGMSENTYKYNNIQDKTRKSDNNIAYILRKH